MSNLSSRCPVSRLSGWLLSWPATLIPWLWSLCMTLWVKRRWCTFSISVSDWKGAPGLCAVLHLLIHSASPIETNELNMHCTGTLEKRDCLESLSCAYVTGIHFVMKKTQQRRGFQQCCRWKNKKSKYEKFTAYVWYYTGIFTHCVT